MKITRIVALLLALTVLTAGMAFAETFKVGNLSIDLPDSMEEFDDDEADEDEVLACGNDSLELYVAYYANDGMTAKDFLSEYKEDTDESSGITTINGIDCAYFTYHETDDDGSSYQIVEYVAEDGDNFADFAFIVLDNSANDTQVAIMNSLTK